MRAQTASGPGLAHIGPVKVPLVDHERSDRPLGDVELHDVRAASLPDDHADPPPVPRVRYVLEVALRNYRNPVPLLEVLEKRAYRQLPRLVMPRQVPRPSGE